MVLERIQLAIDYIDANLANEIDLDTVAAVTGFSLSHFYKLFLAVTGFTIKTYIRNKRLVIAARELITTKRGILDISLEAGFASQEAFTRAFTRLYGLTPAQYRNNRNEILLYDKHAAFGKRLELQHQLNIPRVPIEAKIVEREQIYLVGQELSTSVADTIQEDIIPQFWQEVFIPQIPRIQNIKHQYVSIGYEVHNPEEDRLLHMAAVETTMPEAPEGLKLRILPAARYAVFIPERPLNAIEYGQLVLFAYGEWLPMKGLQQGEDFTLDIYSSDQYFTGYRVDNSRLEVYIPVK